MLALSPPPPSPPLDKLYPYFLFITASFYPPFIPIISFGEHHHFDVQNLQSVYWVIEEKVKGEGGGGGEEDKGM